MRAKLRSLVEKDDVSHDVLAQRLGLSRSYVSRLLNGTGAILLRQVEVFCEFFQMSPSELMAQPGDLIQVISPIESAIIGLIRQMTELERRSLLTLLERPAYGTRETTKTRLGRGMLTAKERELVDLFSRVKKDGVREGVLRTLKGAAEADETKAPVKPHTIG